MPLPTKTEMLYLDHSLQQKGVPLHSPKRRSALSSVKLAIIAALASSVLAAPITNAQNYQIESPRPQRFEGENANYNASASASLKKELLSARVHEALIAEHLLLGRGAAPKKYLPVPGYVNDPRALSDCRVGPNGKLEQNIIQPAEDIHPALLSSLTGKFSSAILRECAEYTKDQADTWPRKRDALANQIKNVWENQQNAPTGNQKYSDTVELEKYRQIADGLMYVITLEKHIDRMESIVDATLSENRQGINPSSRTIADRLLQVQKSQKILRGTAIANVPQDVYQTIRDVTPRHILSEAQSILDRKLEQRPSKSQHALANLAKVLQKDIN